MLGTQFKLSNVKNQLKTVLIVNIATFSSACALGWLSPALPLLESSTTSPLTTGAITISEASWLGSIQYIGQIIGFFLFTFLMRYFGRQKSLCILIFPLIAIWMFVIFAKNVYYLYASRIILGITVGGLLMCVPIFVSEIADDEFRGILGGIMSVMQYLGVLMGYIIGASVPYIYIPYIMLPFSIIFFLLMFTVPETPFYLLQADKREEAEKSIQFYKNCSITNNEESKDKFNHEMEKLIDFTAKKSMATLNLRQIFYPEVRYEFLKVAFLMTISACCGAAVLLNYGANIFSDSGSTFDPNISTIIMGSVQLLGTLCVIGLIDNCGRRFLLIISSSGCAFGLAALGVYNYLSVHGFSMVNFNWIPVTSVSIGLFSICIGIMPVTFVLMAEILPASIRSSGSMICLTLFSGMQFCISKLYPILAGLYHMYSCMWFLSGICVLGLMFNIFVLKETKGKNINK